LYPQIGQTPPSETARSLKFESTDGAPTTMRELMVVVWWCGVVWCGVVVVVVYARGGRVVGWLMGTAV